MLSTPSWKTFREHVSGITLKFPQDVFVVDAGQAALGQGRTNRSKDGRATLMIFSVARAPGTSPADFLTRGIGITGLKFSYNGSRPGFSPYRLLITGRHFTAVATSLSRLTNEMKCIYMDYPAEETRAWDKIVTRISLSLEN